MNPSRRRFLWTSTGLISVAMLTACGLPPLPGSRQARVRRIGFLAVGTREGRGFLVDGFLLGLHEHGYVDGENIAIEYRFSDDQDERLPALAAELVDLKVDVILASGTPASFAARDATTTIPIVMGSVAANPVETGLIASLARPGGNITGMTSISTQLSAKRMQLLQEIVPRLSKVAVFWNPPNPSYGPVLRELEEAAQTLGISLRRLEVRTPADFESALDIAVRDDCGALIIPADPLTTNRPHVVADLALHYRLPAIAERAEFVQAGGLLALGADLADLYRRSAGHVDKIFKGSDPGSLPMEQPSKLDLGINLRTAQALGLTIPPAVLAQGTEILPP